MPLIVNVQQGQEDFLMKLLENLAFVQSVERISNNDNESDVLSDEEKRLLDERWAKYKKEGVSGITWNEMKEQIKKKHGI